ncbi:hypothetical protein Tco_0695447 [Tanacetum coccineum]
MRITSGVRVSDENRRGQDTIVPNGYPKLLSKDNKWDKRNFKDKIPPSISETLMYQRLARHLANFKSFPIHFVSFSRSLKFPWKHILELPAGFIGGKEMAFWNFMFAEDDEEMIFIPHEPSPGFGFGSPSPSINNEPPLLEAEPLASVNPEQLVENTASICPSTELRPLNSMSCSPSSMAYLAILPDFSGLARICLMGLSVNTLMG